MHRRDVLIGATGAAIAVVGASGAADAQDAKQAVEKTFGAWRDALSTLDMTKMMAVWSQGPDTIVLNPRDKEPAIGSDAVRKRWEDTFAFWETLNVAESGQASVHVNGSTAYRYGRQAVSGKSKAGKDMSFATLATTVFEKGDRGWQIVCHHASAVPA